MVTGLPTSLGWVVTGLPTSVGWVVTGRGWPVTTPRELVRGVKEVKGLSYEKKGVSGGCFKTGHAGNENDRWGGPNIDKIQKEIVSVTMTVVVEKTWR